MQTAVGFPVLIRAFRLAQVVEGLRPHAISNYTLEVERFATHFSGRFTGADGIVDSAVFQRPVGRQAEHW